MVYISLKLATLGAKKNKDKKVGTIQRILLSLYWNQTACLNNIVPPSVLEVYHGFAKLYCTNNCTASRQTSQNDQ